MIAKGSDPKYNTKMLLNFKTEFDKKIYDIKANRYWLISSHFHYMIIALWNKVADSIFVARFYGCCDWFVYGSAFTSVSNAKF